MQLNTLRKIDTNFSYCVILQESVPHLLSCRGFGKNLNMMLIYVNAKRIPAVYCDKERLK